MAPIKFLLALSSLAIFSCSALSIDNHIVNRHIAHDSLAKRGGLARRCKPGSSSNSVVTPSSSNPPASTPTPTPTTTTTTYSGTKFGICLADEDKTLSLVSGKANFVYNWKAVAPSNAKDLGLTYVPQLWGSDSARIEQFKTNVVQGYSTHVLGMNEPNESGQSNMSPADGAALWKEHIEPMKALGYQLITPATSSNPNGLTWVTDFMNACQGCTFDKVAIHWYDTEIGDFKTYVNKWYEAFKKPIWITEFACQNYRYDGTPQPDNDKIWNFHVQAAEWLKGVDFVEVAMPFGFQRNDLLSTVNVQDGNRLISSDGNSLTPLGAKLVEIYNS